MFCPKCGNQVKDGASFCNACGAQMAQKSASAPSANMAKPRANVASAALGAVASGAGAVGRNLPGAMKQVKRGSAALGAKAADARSKWARRVLVLSIFMIVLSLFLPWMGAEIYDINFQPFFEGDHFGTEYMVMDGGLYYSLLQTLRFWMTDIVNGGFDLIFISNAIEGLVGSLSGIAGIILVVFGGVSALRRKERGVMFLAIGLLLVFFASDTFSTVAKETFIFPEGIEGLEDKGSAVFIVSTSNGCSVARVFSVVAAIALAVERLGFIGSLRAAADMLTEEAQTKVGFLNQDGVGQSPAAEDMSERVQPDPGTST